MFDIGRTRSNMKTVLGNKQLVIVHHEMYDCSRRKYITKTQKILNCTSNDVVKDAVLCIMNE